MTTKQIVNHSPYTLQISAAEKQRKSSGSAVIQILLHQINAGIGSLLLLQSSLSR